MAAIHALARRLKMTSRWVRRWLVRLGLLKPDPPPDPSPPARRLVGRREPLTRMIYLDAGERIARADMHFECGTKLWDKFIESKPYDYFPEVKADGTGTIKVIPRYNPLPTHFGIEFGEMLYQLRAALDSIVYQAAIYDSGQDPPPNAERLEFPFRDTLTAFQKGNVAKKIAPLGSHRPPPQAPRYRLLDQSRGPTRVPQSAGHDGS